ncbi:hypothetical protein EGW08_011903, partial [Elysia chlorotica]
VLHVTENHPVGVDLKKSDVPTYIANLAFNGKTFIPVNEKIMIEDAPQTPKSVKKGGGISSGRSEVNGTPRRRKSSQASTPSTPKRNGHSVSDSPKHVSAVK